MSAPIAKVTVKNTALDQVLILPVHNALSVVPGIQRGYEALGKDIPLPETWKSAVIEIRLVKFEGGNSR